MKEEKDKVENYRGISLLCSAYKVYAEILRKKLEKEVEEKGLLPESQAGFRKGRSTMDNIFIFNHIVQREREKGKEEGKVFDNVDREILWKIMKEKEIKAGLIRRMRKIYEDIEVTIRSKD